MIFNNNKAAIDASLNTSDFYNYSANSVVDDVTNNIRKFTKLKLQVIPGTNNLHFYKLDTSGNNVLLNTLQINETSFNNDTTYLYNLYSTQGIQTDVEIPSTAEGEVGHLILLREELFFNHNLKPLSILLIHLFILHFINELIMIH